MKIVIFLCVFVSVFIGAGFIFAVIGSFFIRRYNDLPVWEIHYSFTIATFYIKKWSKAKTF